MNLVLAGFRYANIKFSSDKGNGIVILNADDYISKLGKLISNPNKFQEITPDSEEYSANPVVKSQSKLTNFLRKYVRPFVSSDTYNNIMPNGSQPGKLYGMSKVHKPSCSLRPVVSMLNTAEYHLAKYLDS